MELHREVIELSKQGNPRAQYQLYQLYAKAMFNISYRIMNNRTEAEDMLQEAFTEAFKKLDSFRYESNFGSWLKRIVINKCINEMKRRKTDLQYFDEVTHFETVEEETAEYRAGLSIENVKRAMEELPKGSKIIFSLYLLEGYDHKEISQILNISESNSKSQYMRAKNKVKEYLQYQLS
ncbi:MAG: RNA polymerase [Bacteroidetes bacterium HGW-Bacteroidetes-17]|jgi:RNA polymerase sigma-70 factor (ECF subfamily)|nr:MAG: RNA polymerase [Bacteroidetes bacterium HGW-Bacteroidetes-17]